jgi:hypothetical protein
MMMIALLLLLCCIAIIAFACDSTDIRTLSLDVHIVHNGSFAPLIDGLAINAVRNDGRTLRIVGQLFNATELSIFDAWHSRKLAWRVRSRFVIEAALDADLVQLLGSCIHVNVHTHVTFVHLSRDYGRVTGVSAPHSESTVTRFCNVCQPPAAVAPAVEHRRVPLAICSVIRDEAKNLEEWLRWHELLGVERFFLYDDASSDSLRDVLRSRIETGVVTLVEWTHNNYWRQLSGINDCVLSHANDADWIAALDVDEFLFPPQAAVDNVKIIDLLAEQRFADVGAVRIAWLQFSDRVEPEQDGATLTTARFLWRADEPYVGTVTLLSDSVDSIQILAGKSVFRPQHVLALDTTHAATLLPDSRMRAVDADPATELVIRHYAMRDAGARNRWDDTKRWKAKHESELRELFGSTKDDRAQRLTQELESVAL